MRIKSSCKLLFLILLAFSISGLAQSKKNARPGDTDKPKKETPPIESKKKPPVYFYEFEKPEFLIARIRIEHDENGLGKIAFQKKDFENDIVEPLNLSSATIKKLKTNWGELNFLDSEEDYQSKREYPHLGTMRISMKKEKRARTAEFNWTDNPAARALVDEYRKIANKFVWMFDINTARQNQPLESPKIMRRLDTFLSRNAISDPEQMLPFLKELSDDERIPLISRNHASRIAKKIEDAKKRNEIIDKE
ncbi:MAG: hypothetical protein HKN25_08425 [Pyrinomonadaceae bacterium]|nr:hypothetical protein [Pyrinomonadaceae bacterium]